MAGDLVNLEVDVIAKYAERLLQAGVESPYRGLSPDGGGLIVPTATIDEAIAAIAAGGMVVVVDDEDRENEGDLIVAAEHATPEAMAFFVRHTSGLICAVDHRRAGRRTGPAADGRTQHRVAAHRLHGDRRLPRSAPPRASPPPTAR